MQPRLNRELLRGRRDGEGTGKEMMFFVLVVFCIGAVARGNSAFSRVDQLYPPYWQVNQPEEPKLFVKSQAGSVHIRIQGALRAARIWLDLDQNLESGYVNTTYFMPQGSEAYLAFDLTSAGVFSRKPSLWVGCPIQAISDGCAEQVAEIDSSLYSLDTVTDTFEVTLPQRLISPLNNEKQVGDMYVAFSLTSWDWTENVYPMYYNDRYVVFSDLENLLSFPQEKKGNKGGIVFSRTNLNRFWSDKSYNQLFLAMQYQFMQAGLPFERLYCSDLLNIERTSQFDVLVLPHQPWFTPQEIGAIRKALFVLVHYYGVSIVFSGDFLTNRADRKPGILEAYGPMTSLFGITPLYTPFQKVQLRRTVVKTNDNAMFPDLDVGYVLLDETATDGSVYPMAYQNHPRSAFTNRQLAAQELTDPSGEIFTYSAITVVELAASDNPFGVESGKVVHFGWIQLLANVDLTWRALAFLLKEKTGTIGFGLRMGRKDGLFITRWDMDQSARIAECPILTPALFDLYVKPWFHRYNLVGSYYINVGDKVKENFYTNWSTSLPIWEEYLDLENEIGSHSYNHPMNFSDPSTDLEYEFAQSMRDIMGNLSLNRCGAAQPGNPEDLPTALKLERYISSYFSGGFSGVGMGFPGAFGFLRPESQMVYFAPNIYFDFTLFQFFGYDEQQAQDIWVRQVKETARLAGFHMMHYPIHDYGPTNWNPITKTLGDGIHGDYSERPFIAVLDTAFSLNTEFITAMDWSDRIRAFTATRLSEKQLDDSTIQVTVSHPPGGIHDYGVFALSVLQPSKASQFQIDHVGDWYAFDRDKVFLSKEPPRTLTVSIKPKGQASTSLTRISKLDMRISLLRVSGDGSQLSAVVSGRGLVELSLNRRGLMKPSQVKILADSEGNSTVNVDFDNALVTILFAEQGMHSVKVEYAQQPGDGDETGDDVKDEEAEEDDDEKQNTPFTTTTVIALSVSCGLLLTGLALIPCFVQRQKEQLIQSFHSKQNEEVATVVSIYDYDESESSESEK